MLHVFCVQLFCAIGKNYAEFPLVKKNSLLYHYIEYDINLPGYVVAEE